MMLRQEWPHVEAFKFNLPKEGHYLVNWEMCEIRHCPRVDKVFPSEGVVPDFGYSITCCQEMNWSFLSCIAQTVYWVWCIDDGIAFTI